MWRLRRFWHFTQIHMDIVPAILFALLLFLGLWSWLIYLVWGLR